MDDPDPAGNIILQLLLLLVLILVNVLPYKYAFMDIKYMH